MKLFYLFILFACSITYGADGLFVIDFLANSPSTYDRTCWKDENTFDESACEKVISPCSYEKKFPSFKRVKLKIVTGNRNDGGSDYRYRVFVLGLDSTFEQQNMDRLYPVGSDISVYETSGGYREEQKIKLIYQGKMPSHGEINISQNTPAFQKFVFKFPDVLPAGHQFSMSVLNQNLFLEPADLEAAVSLTPGTYYLKVGKIDGRQKMYEIQYIKFNVLPSQVTTPKVVDLQNGFKPFTQPKNDSSITWMSKGYPAIYEPSFRLFSQVPENKLYFDKITKIEIPESPAKLVTDSFEIKSGIAKVKPDKEQAILEILNGLPIHTLKVEGSCFTGKLKPQIYTFDIFEKPDNKSKKLASITFEKGPQRSELKSNYVVDGKSTEYHTNFEFGACRGEGDPDAKHVVKKVEKDWVFMEDAKWSKGGWVKIPSKSVEEYSGLRFNNLYDVSVKILNKNQVQISGLPEEDMESNEQKKVSFKLDISKLWSKDFFLLRPGC